MKKILKPLMTTAIVGCAVLLTSTPLLAKDKSVVKKASVQKGWYIRLQSETNTLKDDKTVFGYLMGASDGKDKYDAEALSVGGSNYLYTVIYHDDFAKADEYRSDYRAYAKIGEKSDTWVIKVKSGNANADVTLSWDGITEAEKNDQGDFIEESTKGNKILSKMRLVDEENSKVIDVKKQDSYTLNMNGKKELELKWMLLKNGEKEPKIKKPKKAALAEYDETTETEIEDSLPPSAKKRHDKKDKKKNDKEEDVKKVKKSPL